MELLLPLEFLLFIKSSLSRLLYPHGRDSSDVSSDKLTYYTSLLKSEPPFVLVPLFHHLNVSHKFKGNYFTVMHACMLHPPGGCWVSRVNLSPSPLRLQQEASSCNCSFSAARGTKTTTTKFCSMIKMITCPYICRLLLVIFFLLLTFHSLTISGVVSVVCYCPCLGRPSIESRLDV